MELALEQTMTTLRKPYAHALASILALTAGALSMSPSSAKACSMAACPTPVRLVSSSHAIPGDLLYFEVLVDDPGPLALHTKAGVAIDASVRTIGDRRVFAPTATVSAGTTVVLEYMACGRDPTPEPHSVEYKTGPAAGVPKLTQPKLTIDKATNTAEDTSVDLRYLLPAPESASHLTYTEVTVDGKRFSDDWHDDAGALLLNVPASCNSGYPSKDTCNVPTEVLPGKHEVSFRTTVVGAEKQPAAAKLSIELTCPPGTNRVDAGASIPRLGAGAFFVDAGAHTTDPGTPTADAGVLETQVAAAAEGQAGAVDPSGADGDGCAVGAAGPNSGLNWAVVVSLLAVVLRTRSRREARGKREP